MIKSAEKEEIKRELTEILERFGLVVTGIEANGTVTVADEKSKDESRRTIT